MDLLGRHLYVLMEAGLLSEARSGFLLDLVYFDSREWSVGVILILIFSFCIFAWTWEEGQAFLNNC